jgi:hypothetical protein
MCLAHVFQTGLHAPREELIAEETRPNWDSLQKEGEVEFRVKRLVRDLSSHTLEVNGYAIE